VSNRLGFLFFPLTSFFDGVFSDGFSLEGRVLALLRILWFFLGAITGGFSGRVDGKEVF